MLLRWIDEKTGAIPQERMDKIGLAIILSNAAVALVATVILFLGVAGVIH